MIDLNVLQSFTTIVQEGSFRAAAKALSKAQPVLSYHVKSLETYLGVALFDRSAYRATLTPDGKRYFQKALTLLKHAQDLDSFKLSLKQGIEAQLALSISSLYPLHDFTEKLKSIQTQFPDTVFSVSIDTLDGLNKVKKKDVDFAISEQHVDDINIKESRCYDMDMVLVCATTHPLASTSSASIQDFAEYPQITLKSSGKIPTKDHGIFTLAKQWLVTDMHTKKQLIQEGFGWGYLPDHTIDHRFHPLDKTHTKNIHFRKVCKQDHLFGPVMQHLWNLF